MPRFSSAQYRVVVPFELRAYLKQNRMYPIATFWGLILALTSSTSTGRARQDLDARMACLLDQTQASANLHVQVSRNSDAQTRYKDIL